MKMKTTVLGREELLDMLTAIDEQLEQLDQSIMSNFTLQHQQWQYKQEMRMEFCDKQLESLERKVASNKEHYEYKPKSMRLKLSY
jgi:hypothetical protein